MRNLLLGAGLLAGLWAVAAAALPPRQDVAAGQAVGHSGHELITWTSPVDDHHQMLAVIDPRLRVLSVYHVDVASGEIALKSVRNLHWDLQMVEFNGVSPLPREIRSMLEQR